MLSSNIHSHTTCSSRRTVSRMLPSHGSFNKHDLNLCSSTLASQRPLRSAVKMIAQSTSDTTAVERVQAQGIVDAGATAAPLPYIGGLAKANSVDSAPATATRALSATDSSDELLNSSRRSADLRNVRDCDSPLLTKVAAQLEAAYRQTSSGADQYEYELHLQEVKFHMSVLNSRSARASKARLLRSSQTTMSHGQKELVHQVREAVDNGQAAVLMEMQGVAALQTKVASVLLLSTVTTTSSSQGSSVPGTATLGAIALASSFAANAAEFVQQVTCKASSAAPAPSVAHVFEANNDALNAKDNMLEAQARFKPAQTAFTSLPKHWWADDGLVARAGRKPTPQERAQLEPATSTLHAISLDIEHDEDYGSAWCYEHPSHHRVDSLVAAHNWATAELKKMQTMLIAAADVLELALQASNATTDRRLRAAICRMALQSCAQGAGPSGWLRMFEQQQLAAAEAFAAEAAHCAPRFHARRAGYESNSQ